MRNFIASRTLNLVADSEHIIIILYLGGGGGGVLPVQHIICLTVV